MDIHYSFPFYSFHPQLNRPEVCVCVRGGEGATWGHGECGDKRNRHTPKILIKRCLLHVCNN